MFADCRVVYQEEARILNRDFEGKPFTMMDIGTGTGLPLKEFLKTSQAKRVLAIDIDESYVAKATERFKDDARVEVRYMNFMDAKGDFTEKFDVVFFGFSFMLMPDKILALQQATKLLSPNGRLFLILTLYDKKSGITEFLKPKIKYLTSIDFGESMYKADMNSLFEKAGVEQVSFQQLQPKGRPLFKVFKVYRIEVKPKSVK